MTTKYMIIEDGELLDGEFRDRDRLFKTIPLCAFGTKILMLDLGEALTGSSPAREVTEDMVREYYEAGHYRFCPLVEEYIPLPMGLEEQRATDADYARQTEGV